MGGVGTVKSGKREVVHSRARVCRSRRYRRLHRAGYSHRAAATQARGNKWPAAAEESRLRQKRDAEPFLSRRARHFLRRRQQCPSPPRSLSPSSPAYYSRGAAERAAAAGGMPTHRISREMRAWPYRKPSTLFFATAHSLPPRSPSPSLPSSLPPFPLLRQAD